LGSTVSYKEKLYKAKGKRDLLIKQIEETKTSIRVNHEELDTLEKAQAFIQDAAKKTQENLKFHVEDVVNLALEALFPNQYKFELKFDIKYGKTAAFLVFTKNGYEVNILKSGGGGVVDIASLALRVAIWSISKTDNVLILDEPVRNIQPASLQIVAWNIIKELSKRLNLQFIIVSNSSNNGEATKLVSDKVFLVKKEPTILRGEEYEISRAEVEE